MTTVPPNDYRFGEASFRKYYERVIANVVDVWPACITITPNDCEALGLAAETVRGRLRDAIDSFKTNRWTTSMINMEKWNAIPDPNKDIKVMMVKGTGVILVGRDKENLANRTPLSFEVATACQTVFDCSSVARQNLIVDLALAGLFPNGVLVSGFNSQDTEHFSSLGDIAFSPQQQEGIYLLR